MAIARRVYLACFIIGLVLIRLGTPAMAVLSLPHLDDNCSNEDSAFYVGVISSMLAWGPVLGVLLAVVCTSVPENIVGPTNLSPDDPRWIGAWWLGYLTLGIALLLPSLPMALFPKHMKYYYIDNNKDSEEKKMGCTSFCKLFWQLCRNIPFLLLVFSRLCGLYVVHGIFFQLPDYIEIHFGQPERVAKILSGTSLTIVCGGGTILGGYLMKRLKLGVLGSAKMYVYARVISVIAIFISMFLGCSQPPISGTYDSATNSLDVSMACNTGCACPSALHPVCMDGTTTYISPCHAGCTAYNPLNHTFSNCACAGPDVTVSEGYCTSIACGMITPYMIFTLIGCSTGAVGSIPGTMLLFRIVKKEVKAFAFGIQTLGINFLCYAPAAVMFSVLRYAACRLWEMTCDKRGSCLIYDVTKFRYHMHGGTLFFLVLSLVFGTIMLRLITKQEKMKNQDSNH